MIHFCWIKMAMSQIIILCGICKEQEIIKNADKWCPECDEGLCFDCEKHHRISKSSRHHAVISIEDYKGLPSEISEIYHHCEIHERKFQMYCPYHDKPCCLVCISKDHKTCTGLVTLEDVVKNAKTSSLMETIEQSLRESEGNIQIIIKDREKNLRKLKEQRKPILDKIKQTREDINNHLDNLERKFINKLDAAEKLLTSQIEQLLGQLNEKSKVVKQLQHNLAAIKAHASDLQTFLGSKQLERQAHQEETFISSLVRNESLQITDLDCTINEKIVGIETISTFGSVTIAKGQPSVTIHTEKNKQAQMMSPIRVESGSIDNIKLKLIRTFNLPQGQRRIYLTGCAMLQNDTVAFVDSDFNRRIIITNDHGILQSEISMSPSHPFDVTCLDNNSVAVTSQNDKNINIINTSSQTTTKTIPTTAMCHGITNREGTLIYCEHGKGIILHQLGTKSSNTIVRQNLPHCTYVASNENNIYITDNVSHTVTCYSLNGDKIWDFKDTSILQYPYGVAVDKHSNVYVTSYRNDSIILISSDGKKSRQTLISEDGIVQPRALAVNKGKDKLLVTSNGGGVCLYEISSI